jgi:hypothetical protein
MHGHISLYSRSIGYSIWFRDLDRIPLWRSARRCSAYQTNRKGPAANRRSIAGAQSRRRVWYLCGLSPYTTIVRWRLYGISERSTTSNFPKALWIVGGWKENIFVRSGPTTQIWIGRKGNRVSLPPPKEHNVEVRTTCKYGTDSYWTFTKRISDQYTCKLTLRKMKQQLWIQDD